MRFPDLLSSFCPSRILSTGHLGDSVKYLPLTQVMILRVLGMSPALGSLLSGEPASCSPCAAAPCLCFLTFCQINKILKKKKKYFEKTLYSTWQEIINVHYLPIYYSRIQGWDTALVLNENSLLGRKHRNTADVEREEKSATGAETLFNFVRLHSLTWLSFICLTHHSQLENTPLKEVIVSYNFIMKPFSKSTLGKNGYCTSAVINLLNTFPYRSTQA